MPSLYEHEPISAGGEPQAIEYVEVTEREGVLLYIKGHKYPVRGLPTAEALHAIAVAKRLMLALPFCARPSLLTNAAMVALRPVLPRLATMCPPARAVRCMTPEPYGSIFGSIIEYDSAYRVRLQDMVAAVPLKDIINRPIASVWAMIRENRRHDYIGVHLKLRKAAILLTLLLLWPPFRSAWKKVWVPSMYDNFMPTKGDLYWRNQRTDYGPLNGNPISGDDLWASLPVL